MIGLGEALDADIVGMKAAALGDLLTGFAVPDGFVVSTAAFAASARPMTLGLRAALGEALRRFPETALAVRSSSVAEDLPDAAHAGLYETVLDVRGEAQVIAAIEQCWASASSARVAAYRARRATTAPPRTSGERVTAPGMAVLVQQMVPASASGVAFTADPVTGNRDVVRVSATMGLGERLVSMAADADEWEVRADRVTPMRTPEQALSEEHVREVARLARRVEAHFGGVPQDIEWAYWPAGRLHLLQARPITALPEMLAFTAPAPGSGSATSASASGSASRSRHCSPTGASPASSNPSGASSQCARRFRYRAPHTSSSTAGTSAPSASGPTASRARC